MRPAEPASAGAIHVTSSADISPATRTPAALSPALVALPLTLAAALLGAVPAMAVPATEAGADRISQALARYVGSVPGVVQTVPDGETYRLTLDAAPLLDRLGSLVAAFDSPPDPDAPDPDMSDPDMSDPDLPPSDTPFDLTPFLPEFSVAPVTFTLTDRGDGTWGVQQAEGLEFRMTLPGLISTERVSDMRLDGIFDPRLGTFSTMEMVETDLRTVDRRYAGDDLPVSETETTLARSATRGSAVANPRGGIDMQSTQEVGPWRTRQKIFYSDPDPQTGLRNTFSVEADVARMSGQFATTGLRMTELLHLWAWAVAQPSVKEAVARQDELKALLRAALPLFQDTRLSAPIEDLRVTTAIARGGFKRIDTAFDMTGLVPEGRVRLALGLSGPDLPVMMLDPWMRPLVPQSAGIDVTMTGFDMAAAADMTLTALDLTLDDPLAALDVDALARAVLPTGRLRVDLAPSLIEAADYSVAYGGWLETGPAVGGPAVSGDPPVAGQLRIEASGLDQVEAQIAAGFGRNAARTLATLRHLRTLSEKADGRDLWVIDLAKLDEFLTRATPPMELDEGTVE